jgi:hypothetical protein
VIGVFQTTDDDPVSHRKTTVELLMTANPQPNPIIAVS